MRKAMPSTYRSTVAVSVFTESDRRRCERPYASVADLLPLDNLLVYRIAFTGKEAGRNLVLDARETGR